MHKTSLILFLFLCLIPDTYGQKDVRTVNNAAFKKGEKIVYKVAYNLYFNMVVGEVEFLVKNELEDISKYKAYHITADAKTYPFYDYFFKVRDHYDCWAETQSLLPLVSNRQVREGSYKSDEMVVYNQKKNKVKTPKHIKSVPKHTMDVLGAIYYARTLNFDNAKPGDKYVMDAFLDDSAYHVGVKYTGKENITTEAGKFRCIKLVPVLIADRVFKNNDGMNIWITDDQNHIPVRIESGISVGAVRADLYKYSDLKNTLSSKLK